MPPDSWGWGAKPILATFWRKRSSSGWPGFFRRCVTALTARYPSEPRCWLGSAMIYAPLTRMRLQMALMPKTAETDALEEDIIELEQMIDGYLAFARGEGEKVPKRAVFRICCARLSASMSAPPPGVSHLTRQTVRYPAWLCARKRCAARSTI